MPAYDALRFTATTGQTDFLITFDYRTERPETIVIAKDGVEQMQGVDYNLVDYYTARFTAALNGGEKVIIRRVTDRDDRPISWNNESPLSRANHNKQDDETFRLIQELWVEKGLPRSDITFNWTAEDANGDPLKIEDVNDPVEGTDVVNLRYLESRLGGQTIGLAGYYRGDFIGDGATQIYEIIPSGGGQLSATSKVLVWKQGDSNPVDPDDYSLDSTKRKIVFNQPTENGVRYDWFVLTASVVTISDGDILPSKIALTANYFLRGDVSDQAEAVAKSSIPLSGFGDPAADISMNLKSLTNLPAPTAANDAARKAYVDTAVSAVQALATVTNNNSYSRNTAVQNSASVTKMIIANLEEDSQVGAEVIFQAQYADDPAQTTNLVQTGQRVRFYDAAGRRFHKLIFLVPAGKYWMIKATSGSDSNLNKISIYYQEGY